MLLRFCFFISGESVWMDELHDGGWKEHKATHEARVEMNEQCRSL